MIGRDGFTESLWQATAAPYRAKNLVDEHNVFDVIIVGGGITGMATALQLQEAGKKCLVVEARNLCFGTTGGTTAHLNTLLDTTYHTIEKNFSKQTAQQVADAAGDAISLIRHNIQQHAISCAFKEANAYLFAQTHQQEKELQVIFDATAAVGVNAVYDNNLPFPFSFTKAMKVTGQAKFNPVEYVYGIAAAYENAGGCLLQDCRVTHVDNDTQITATTSQGKYMASDIIYATHIPPGVNLLHLRCAPYRTYAMAVILDNEMYPKDLAYDMEDPYHYYRTQNIDCTEYLIAGGKDHKTGDQQNTDYLFTELETTIRGHFSVKEIAYKWSSQYFEPADGLPYIGHLPGHPDNIYVATGYGGNGMIYSHVAARVLTAILLNREDALIHVFNPNRIKPVAGFSNFITHNAGVISNFAGKLFSADKLHELSGLARGEAKIVQYDGEKIGLYKDETGQLHAVNPVCTHLKCEVKWNSAEQSWDCPCHGARYDCDGKVLTGPADHSLEPISIQELEAKAHH